MVEDLGDTITKGFDTWKNNLIICLPFVFNLVISTVITLVIMGFALFATIPSLVPYLINPPEMSPDSFLDIMPKVLDSVLIIFTSLVITLILVLLIGAFFNSGAVGMAKEATKSGRTDLSDMSKYGRKKFVSLFIASVIINLISFFGVIFLIPGFMELTPILTTSKNIQPEDVFMILPLLGLGFLAMSIYVFFISVIFAPARYAIVIDDLSAIEGLKGGFKFFWHNKIEVFLLFIIMILAIMVPTFFVNIPRIGNLMFMAILVIISQPLIVIWWSRLYLKTSKTSKPTDSEPTEADLVKA